VLAWIIRRSLRHSRLIAAACVVFVVYGALLVPTESLDLFPNLSPARTSIETEAPGMVAEQVEQLVTRPIENALIGARGVAAVHSQSIQGLSVVTLELQADADPYRVRQAISESLVQTAGALPGGVSAPRLAPLSATDGELLKVGFISDHLTPMALREIVQWTVRPRLLSVPGVASAQVFGGQARRIEVRARSGDLSDSDLGYGDVFAAVRRATGVAGAGFIETPTQRVFVEPHGQALTLDDVAAGQIQVVGSAPTRISDVADVVVAPAPAIGDALIMGKPGVILSIVAQYGANTLDTSRAVERALAPLTAALAGQGVKVNLDLDRPAGFISGAVREIAWDVVFGAVLIVVLLILFLRDWRAALVSFIGIPLSITAAIIVLKLLGWSVNTMTLGGLAVALGLVVDDSLIDVENIVGRLRQAQIHHTSRARAVLKASLEVRAPVIYATVLIMIGLLPILFLSGVQGALIRPLAATIVIAMLASLTIAILVTPALALLLLDHIGLAAPPRWVDRLKMRYDASLERIGGGPGLVFGVLGVLAVVSIVAFVTFKIQFLPTFRSGHLTARISAPPSTSMAVMRDYGARITRDLLADPKIAAVSEQIGRAETGDVPVGPEQARFDIELAPHLNAAAQDRMETEIRGVLAAYPGLDPDVRSSLTLSPLGTERGGAVQARIYGDDLNALDLAASRVATALSATPGAHNVTTTAATLAPVVRVDLNFQRLAIYGLSAADVLETVQTAFEGRTAARVYENGRAIDVAVTAQDALRRDPEGVGDLLLRSSSGLSTPLKNVANIYLSDGRTSIEHDSGLRRQIVYADPPRDVGRFIRLAQSRIAKSVTLPAGAYLELSPPEEGASARARLLTDGALAAGGILVLLLIAFGSVRASGIILGVTGFAFVGGVAAVMLMGGVLSLGALAGFVTLFGLSTRNAMILIARVDDLVSTHKLAWCEETVRVAAGDRFSPILFSALLIAAGLTPLALQTGDPGHEILGPMVWVILGGLLTSSAMSLFFSPALVFQLWRPKLAGDGRPGQIAASE
jgi:CzcA family heavy metal efflux pump